MSIKNKALVNKGIRSGKLNFKAESYFCSIAPNDPLMFVNSDKFNKMQNRNKKRK